MNTDETTLESLSYHGEHNGITFRCSPARYAKGKMSIQIQKDERNATGFKGAADRLLDVLNARYSRRSGYMLSPSRAVQWRDLFITGWDAETDLRGCYGCKTAPLLESPDGRKMPLKDALKEMAKAKGIAA